MSVLDAINGCVLIPTYNNAKTLSGVLDGVLKYGSGKEILVVNDGSTDGTSIILSSYADRITVLTNTTNTGKGFSLRKGFKEAIRLGFDYVISLDSDGQHFTENIPAFIETIQANPGAMIMGIRNMKQDGIPSKSSFGNKISSFSFMFETGINLSDTQTGFRLYPLAPMKKFTLYTNKFETEIEVIVRLAWQHVHFISLPIKTIYLKEDRVTHFRPLRDFTRVGLLHAMFITMAIIYYLPRRAIRKLFEKSFWQAVKEEAIKPKETNFAKAASVGFGVFMGIVPIWGFQLLVGIPLALLMKMNKVLFITAAHITFPPMIPVAIYCSYETGGYFVKDSVSFESLSDITFKSIQTNFIQYCIGAIVLAILAGVAAFVLTLGTLMIFRKDPVRLKKTA